MKDFLKATFRGLMRALAGSTGFLFIYACVYAFKDIANAVGFAVLWKLFLSVISLLVGILMLYIAGCDE